MHADLSKPDDLSDLERRLAAWQPTAQGLDADRMLYAAGRASVRPSMARCRTWQGVSLVLTAALIVLGIEFRAEKERQGAWANHRPAVSSPTPEEASTPEPNQVASSAPLSAASLFAARRALDAGIDAWRSAEAPTTADTESPAQPILQVWQADRLLER